MHDGSGGHGGAGRRDQLQGGGPGSWKGRGWGGALEQGIRLGARSTRTVASPSLPGLRESENPEVTPRDRRLLSSWTMRLVCLGFLK